MYLSMLNVFSDNPMLIVALIAFLVCVVIGFFGDSYLRKQNKIGKILGGNKPKEKQEETPKEDQTISDTNIQNQSPLITSENINTPNEVAISPTGNTNQNNNGVSSQTNDNVAPSFDTSTMNASGTGPAINDGMPLSFDIQQNNNMVNPILNSDSNTVPSVQNPDPNLNVTQSGIINEKISTVIAPNIEQPIITDPLTSNYPAENSPQNVSGAPTPFDGQVTMDENINNMF